MDWDQEIVAAIEWIRLYRFTKSLGMFSLQNANEAEHYRA